MSKNSDMERKVNDVLSSTTSYSFDLSDIDVNKYTPALNELFNDKDFAEMMERRNRLRASFMGLRPHSSEQSSMLKHLGQQDQKIAYEIFRKLVSKNIEEKEVKEVIPFNLLLRYYVDYSKDGMVERVNTLTRNLHKITFLVDVLDAILLDVKEDMKTVFNGEMQFQQFDVVSNTMKQISRYFGHVLSGDAESPLGQLFFAYADSINDYVDKRMKTYCDKRQKLLPGKPVYGEDDIVQAMNQFFGTEHKFGHQFLKHTRSGGCYIDAILLCSNLNVIESEKLDKALGRNVDYKNQGKYDLMVTEVILENYKKQ